MMVVSEVDKASEAWGVKVLRYEIKNINPPQDVLAAMEKQMRAEREKRATVLQSEGQRDAAINTADGDKQQVIKASEAKKQQAINEAEGQAAAIQSVADRDGERHQADRRRHQDAGRLRGDAASPRRGVHQAVRPAREERQLDDHPGEPERRQLDHRHGHERVQAVADATDAKITGAAFRRRRDMKVRSVDYVG